MLNCVLPVVAAAAPSFKASIKPSTAPCLSYVSNQAGALQGAALRSCSSAPVARAALK